MPGDSDTNLGNTALFSGVFILIYSKPKWKLFLRRFWYRLSLYWSTAAMPINCGHTEWVCPVLKVTRNSGHQFTGLVLMTFPSLFTAHEQEGSLALKNTIMWECLFFTLIFCIIMGFKGCEENFICLVRKKLTAEIANFALFTSLWKILRMCTAFPSCSLLKVHIFKFQYAQQYNLTDSNRFCLYLPLTSLATSVGSSTTEIAQCALIYPLVCCQAWWAQKRRLQRDGQAHFLHWGNMM